MNLGGTVRLNRTGWILLVGALCLLLLINYVRSPGSVTLQPQTGTSRCSVTRLLRAAVEAARAGGAAVRGTPPGGGESHSKGKTAEGVEQPVTEADLESHCRMSAVLKAAFPALHLISEEQPKACPQSSLQLSDPTLDVEEFSNLPEEYVFNEDVTVWIDPLDATKEFTEKLYKYVTTMVCVAIKGVPVIGVIYKPFTKEMSWTWLATASSPNIKQFSKENAEKSPNPTRVIVSISHQGKVKDFASSVFGSDHEIIPAGGAGYKVLELVHDRADVYMHKTLIKKWDICAGNAILNYFNGKMTTLKNATIDYSYTSSEENVDGLLASMKNHDRYMEKIKLLGQ